MSQQYQISIINRQENIALTDMPKFTFAEVIEADMSWSWKVGDIVFSILDKIWNFNDNTYASVSRLPNKVRVRILRSGETIEIKVK